MSSNPTASTLPDLFKKKSRNKKVSESSDANLQPDHNKRNQMLVQFHVWLGERDILYIPLDVREEIDASAADDPMDVFKENLNGWARELVKAKERSNRCYPSNRK